MKSDNDLISVSLIGGGDFFEKKDGLLTVYWRALWFLP